MRLRKLLALAIFFLIALPHARAQCTDSLLCLTNYELEQDSTEASTDVMVPFRSELVRAAHRHQVPAALLAGVTQEESGFKQYAYRTEPGYLKNAKIKRFSREWSKKHGGIPTSTSEQWARSTSFGLMQIMGEGAREQGYDSTYLTSLFDPKNAIEQGAIKLHTLFQKYGRDTMAVISAYNQGNARKTNGHFDNVRYVYRVSIAWKHYQTALGYATHTRSAQTGQMAQRHLDPARDSGLPQTTDAGSRHEIIAHDSAAKRDTALAPGYGMASRHSSVGITAIFSKIKSTFDDFNDRNGLDDFFWTVFGLLALALLGLVVAIWRYERRWTRHDRDLLQPSGRSFLRSSWPRTESASRRSTLRGA